MRFAYPWFLLFLSVLPPVALIWLWLFRRRQRALARFIAVPLQQKLLPQDTESRFWTQFTLVLISFALLCIASARPQWGMSGEAVLTKGRNIVIAIDVSRSMLAKDVHPNRLERAKADVMDLIDDLNGDRAALLAFRNKGSLLCPLTTDYAFLRQALDGISSESAPRGETDLGDAIRKSLDALNPALDEYNAILLISDGGDLRGDALAAAKKSAERNIPIFTVGIGDVAEATIPSAEGNGTQKYKGTEVKTRLDSKTLEAIASASNGRYIPLGTASTAQTTLGAIYRRHLRQVAAKEMQEQLENRYQERYQFFLIPALLLLFVAAWFSKGRLLGAKRCIATAVFLLACTAFAEEEATTNEPPAIVVAPGREGAREAQTMLKDGKFSDAAQAFLSAMRGAEGEEAEEYRYNAAYCYAMASNTVSAIEQLRMLLPSKTNGAKSGELLGKLLLEKPAEEGENAASGRLESLEEAAQAFQRSLRDNPDDARRQRNLFRAVSPIAEARENAHIAEVLKANQGAGPDQLAGKMLAEQRTIWTDAQGVFTNDAAQMIAQAEALAKRQRENADLWIALKGQIAQNVTNQQQQAQVLQQAELLRNSMTGVSFALEDANSDAQFEAGQSEPGIYQFWKACAMPPAVVDEDLLCQSNAIHALDVPYYNDKDTQFEALSLTKIFRERFPQWAQQYQAQAQQNTNMPPFTAEDQAKIEKLAGEVEELQSPKDGKVTGLDKILAYGKLEEIRKLLPNNNQNQNQNDNQQQQQNQQDQQQNQQQEQQQEQQQQKQQDKKPQENRDVQEILRRALDREKEHEEEKKERMRKIPLAPNERDW